MAAKTKAKTKNAKKSTKLCQHDHIILWSSSLRNPSDWFLIPSDLIHQCINCGENFELTDIEKSIAKYMYKCGRYWKQVELEKKFKKVFDEEDRK